jgi:hypothetical protein
MLVIEKKIKQDFVGDVSPCLRPPFGVLQHPLQGEPGEK